MRRTWSTGSLVTLAVAVAAAVLPASVYSQDSQNAAIAEALFREGQALLKAGKVHEACEKLSASLQIEPAVGTMLNLAVCHEQEGKLASAWAELAEAASRAAQAGQKDRESFARARIKTLEPRLLRAVLDVSAPAKGQELRLDGRGLPRAACLGHADSSRRGQPHPGGQRSPEKGVDLLVRGRQEQASPAPRGTRPGAGRPARGAATAAASVFRGRRAPA